MARSIQYRTRSLLYYQQALGAPGIPGVTFGKPMTALKTMRRPPATSSLAVALPPQGTDVQHLKSLMLLGRPGSRACVKAMYINSSTPSCPSLWQPHALETEQSPLYGATRPLFDAFAGQRKMVGTMFPLWIKVWISSSRGICLGPTLI